MDEATLLDLKRLLAPGILAVPGVSGVGLGDRFLNVYLDSDNDKTRRLVEDVVRATAAAAPIRFVVTGPFERRDTER